MSEYVIDVGAFDWTVSGTNVGNASDPNVNLFYQYAAQSMVYAGGYADRIRDLAASVQADTATLSDINLMIQGGVPAGWGAGTSTYPPPADALDAVQAKSDALVAAGVALSPDTAKAYTFQSVPSNTYDLGPATVFQYPPEILPSLLVYAPNQQTSGVPPYTITQPIVTSLDPLKANYGLPQPVLDSLQDTTAAGPGYPKMYSFSDFPGQVFAKINGTLHPVQTSTSTTPASYSMQTFERNPPTAAAVANMSQDGLKKAADTITQVSQGKQAFLQDLMASMAKFTDFATNLIQRDERTRDDIIGRF